MSLTDYTDYQDFQDRLLPGEAIVWAGRPRGGIRFTSRDIFLVPFSLLWGGFAIFWEAGVTATRRAPIFFSLWGIPFVLVGLYMIFGRFFHDAWLRSRTRYAVTNQRILILRKGSTIRFTAVSLDNLPALNLDEKSDGSGTIRFGEPFSPYSRNNFGGLVPSLDPVPQFLNIAAARSVFDKIQSLSRAGSRSSP